MKTGFVTEVHVVIYCDLCGDIYSASNDESTCFDSVHQAVGYINAHSAGVGWIYDGDKVMCDGCIATALCEDNGHRFPKPRVPARLLLTTPNSRICTVCGISEKEVQS